MRASCLVALFAAVAIACGDSGGSSSSPTATAPPTTSVPAPSGFSQGSSVRIVSSGDGSPVAGATLEIAGVAMAADASGAATLSQNFNPGALVDITAPGFLTRQTLVRPGQDLRFGLIPTEGPSGITEAFITEVMFHDSTGTSRRMMRLRPETAMAYVAPSEQILRDPRAMATLQDAVSEVNTITRGEVVFVIEASPPAGSLVFDLVIDPAELGEDVVGVAARRFSGWNIIGGTVIYDSIESVRTSTTHHELGHMLGLAHSASRADVMFPFLRRAVDTFAPRERLAVRLILDRPAANRQPDNDRDVSSALTLETEWSSVVECYR